MRFWENRSANKNENWRDVSKLPYARNLGDGTTRDIDVFIELKSSGEILPATYSSGYFYAEVLNERHQVKFWRDYTGDVEKWRTR